MSTGYEQAIEQAEQKLRKEWDWYVDRSVKLRKGSRRGVVLKLQYDDDPPNALVQWEDETRTWEPAGALDPQPHDEAMKLLGGAFIDLKEALLELEEESETHREREGIGWEDYEASPAYKFLSRLQLRIDELAWFLHLPQEAPHE